MLNRLLFSVTNNPVSGLLVSMMERVDRRAPQVLRVLTYHRVTGGQHDRFMYPRVTINPEAFVQQVRFISRRYRVVSMTEVLRAATAGSRLPERAVLISFDDAYRDFAEYAMPVIRRYGVPVTLFVPTAFPDHPELAFWWDKLYSAIECAQNMELVQTPLGLLPVATSQQRKETFSHLRDYVKSTPHQAAMEWVNRFCEELEAPSTASSVLSWQELRQLAREGVTLGAHTRTHPMMNQISLAQVRDEAVGSLLDLQDQIGDTPPIFAYPSGGFNQEVTNILREEGFQLAFTTQRGLNDFQNADRLQLKRINIGPKTSLTLLRAQMLSWMKVIDR